MLFVDRLTAESSERMLWEICEHLNGRELVALIATLGVDTGDAMQILERWVACERAAGSDAHVATSEHWADFFDDGDDYLVTLPLTHHAETVEKHMSRIAFGIDPVGSYHPMTTDQIVEARAEIARRGVEL